MVLCGGIRSIETMEKLNKEKGIELFSISRPLISEPDLPHKWEENTNYKSRCVSCNNCYDIYKCILDK